MHLHSKTDTSLSAPDYLLKVYPMRLTCPLDSACSYMVTDSLHSPRQSSVPSKNCNVTLVFFALNKVATGSSTMLCTSAITVLSFHLYNTLTVAHLTLSLLSAASLPASLWMASSGALELPQAYLSSLPVCSSSPVGAS